FNKVLQSALKAAKKYGRAISVMYDLSGCRSEDIALVDADWKELVKTFKLTDPEVNPTYLLHRGKPLMTIWGVGFNDRRRYTIADVDQLVDRLDRKSTRLNSSHVKISYAVFCLKKKKTKKKQHKKLE